MPGLVIDLNEPPPESGNLYPVDWDDIVEYDGPADQLDYDMVWEDDGSQGVQGDGADGLQVDGGDASDHVQEQGEQNGAGTQGMQLPEADGLQGAATNGACASGSSNRRRMYYSDDPSEEERRDASARWSDGRPRSHLLRRKNLEPSSLHGSAPPQRGCYHHPSAKWNDAKWSSRAGGATDVRE